MCAYARVAKNLECIELLWYAYIACDLLSKPVRCGVYGWFWDEFMNRYSFVQVHRIQTDITSLGVEPCLTWTGRIYSHSLLIA